MAKLYNTQSDITIALCDFFKNVGHLRKTQLNILPAIIFGIAISESCITNDIVKVLKDDFNLVYPTSTERRIRRFFNNTLFDNYTFLKIVLKILFLDTLLVMMIKEFISLWIICI